MMGKISRDASLGMNASAAIGGVKIVINAPGSSHQRLG
jgi:hypothetical protein